MPLIDLLWLCAAAVCGTVAFFASCWTLVHPQLGLIDLAALAASAGAWTGANGYDSSYPSWMLVCDVRASDFQHLREVP